MLFRAITDLAPGLLALIIHVGEEIAYAVHRVCGVLNIPLIVLTIQKVFWIPCSYVLHNTWKLRVTLNSTSSPLTVASLPQIYLGSY